MSRLRAREVLNSPSAPDLVCTGEKRIGRALAADGGFRSVTRVNHKIVIEAEYVPADRINELIIVSTRQVRPADRAKKQTVADKNFAFFFFRKHHMSARVAGTVPNAKTKISDLIFLAVLPVARQRRRVLVVHAERGHLVRSEAEQQGLFWKAIIKVLVLFVQNDLSVGKCLVQRRGPADVIEMSVRQRDGL